jgi:hypothetical protein
MNCVKMAEHHTVSQCHPIFDASQSHHTRYDTSGRFIVSVHRALPQSTRHRHRSPKGFEPAITVRDLTFLIMLSNVRVV